MKNKIAIASAFLAASSFSMGEIVVNEYLSFEGFIDMAYTYYDGEIDRDRPDPDINESDNTFRIDQVEISWLFDFDPVTAQIDLEYEESGDDLEVEQAFITYHFDGNLKGSTLTAGRYASMLGFEAYEPTGLYQYSTAYGLPNFIGDFGGDDELGDGLVILESALFPVGARFSQGVKYSCENDETFFGISIQDGTVNYDNRFGGDGDIDGTAVDGGGYGAEIAFAYNFGNGFTYFIGGSYEEGDGISTDNDVTSGDTESYVINTYVTYETGVWLFAAELNYGDSEMDDWSFFDDGDTEIESIASLLMANYAYNEQASVTGRVSYNYYDIDVDGSTSTFRGAHGHTVKLTGAHNYAFTDNLLLVTELSYTVGEFNSSGSLEDIDPVGDGDINELLAAVELLFTF